MSQGLNWLSRWAATHLTCSEICCSELPSCRSDCSRSPVEGHDTLVSLLRNIEGTSEAAGMRMMVDLKRTRQGGLQEHSLVQAENDFVELGY